MNIHQGDRKGLEYIYSLYHISQELNVHSEPLFGMSYFRT